MHSSKIYQLLLTNIKFFLKSYVGILVLLFNRHGELWNANGCSSLLFYEREREKRWSSTISTVIATTFFWFSHWLILLYRWNQSKLWILTLATPLPFSHWFCAFYRFFLQEFFSPGNKKKKKRLTPKLYTQLGTSKINRKFGDNYILSLEKLYCKVCNLKEVAPFSTVDSTVFWAQAVSQVN